MIKLENKNKARYFLNLKIFSKYEYLSKMKIYLKYNHQGQEKIPIILHNNNIKFLSVNNRVFINQRKRKRVLYLCTKLLNDNSENLIEIQMFGKIKSKKLIKSINSNSKRNKIDFFMKSKFEDDYIPHLLIPRLISKFKINVEAPINFKVFSNIKPNYRHLIQNFKQLYFESVDVYPFIKNKKLLKIFCFTKVSLEHYKIHAKKTNYFNNL